MAKKARVLIGDMDSTTTLRMSAKLSAEGYEVSKAETFEKFLQLLAGNIPDAVLLGQFAGISQKDSSLRVKETLSPRPLPIMLFNCTDNEQDRVDALETGAQDMVEGVPSDSLLIRRINLLTRLSTMQNELLRRTETAKEFGIDVEPWLSNRFDGKESQVLLISNTKIDVSAITSMINSFDLRTDTEHDFYRAADRLDAERFDACIILVEDDISKEQALYLCSHLRNNPRQFNMPVIILSESCLLEDETEAYRAGATIVMQGDTNNHLVATHCKMLVHGQRTKWSMRDPILATQTDETSDVLHGVYSSSFFDNHLARVLEDTSLRQSELSIAIFAIRNAPDVKSRFGEEACDVLMQQMADWIQGLLRIEDMTARIGPYEFAVLLPDTPVLLASMVANRITGILHHSEFRLTDEIMEAINVWVDLGVCSYEAGDDSESILQRAKSSIY